MRIHAATQADLELLAPLFSAYLQFYEVEKPASEVREFLQQRLARGDSTVFIALDDDGSGLGFVQLYPLFASLMLQPSWLLSDLFVAPQARCRGVGEALMNRARDHAQANGACGLQLETAKTNLAGQRLYERLGYVRDEAFYTYWLNLA
ncbi:GNAT family N-acetyltransferase [Pseudomonas sp. GD03944]|uniref:GNAT family N-acetyltransferase n=1 Tax=Pseudomonas sp. GD03944 TaxID=2975409 RepID=UPI002446BF45|nr:GNAT family N-acetyltransferase [Pseudomonas sp. GD03944]MDH1263106.1 GNAT family N-acetyltransferase [Pseudomonas sp. GD03944]